MDNRTARRLEDMGGLLARGEGFTKAAGAGTCPVCASDFFRIEPPEIVCPVCGSVGDLEVYRREGRFDRRQGSTRWGLSWLDRHIASWIEPSLERYRERRRQVLEKLKDLKASSSGQQGKG